MGYRFFFKGVLVNVLDILRLCFDCVSVVIILNVSWERTENAVSGVESTGLDHIQRMILACWCAMHWLHTLNSFRCFYWFGPRVLPIIYALWASKVFFGVLAFCIAPAVHAYYVLAASDEPGPFLAAAMPMLRLAVM